jgi:hypothetical protein
MMSDGKHLEAKEFTKSLVYIAFNWVTADKAIVRQGSTSLMMLLLNIAEDISVGDDEAGRRVQSSKLVDLSLCKRQLSQGIPTLDGVSDAMWTERKLRRLLCEQRKRWSGGEEVDQCDRHHAFTFADVFAKLCTKAYLLLARAKLYYIRECKSLVCLF